MAVGTPWGRSWRAGPPKTAMAKGAKKLEQKEAESVPVTPVGRLLGDRKTS
jgi:hypothetical protein